jgi:PAS domain S-box-containing protein
MGLWQFNYVSIFYFAALTMSLISAYRAVKLQPVRGAKEFFLLCASISIWCAGYILNFYNTELYWKLIFLRFEYLGIILSTYFWLIFIISYTNYESLHNRKAFILLAVIPVISYIFVLTVNYNHFFYNAYSVAKVNGLMVFRKQYAFGFYILITYIYLSVIIGGLLLLHSVQQMPAQQRKQALPIALIVFVILLSNILFVLKINPFDPYDLTPVSFVFIGIGFGFLNSRYDFLDVVPIAYNQIFRSVNSGIIIIDKREYIIELNTYAEKILSRSSAKVLGKPLKTIFPECAQIIGNNEDSDLKTELRFGKDLRTYSLNISSIKNVNGNISGKIIMLYDITDLKNALDDLETYAHTVAHDLKNPLGSLIGFSEILEDDDVTDELKAESISIIKSSSEQMVQIVNGLLLLASVRRIEDIKLSRIDTKSIIDKLLFRLNNQIVERGGIIHYPKVWPEAQGYEPWIEEVWANYISNALKYGGTPPEITLGADKEDGYVKFWVKDNGIGLSTDDQKNLFKEFDRLAYRSNEPGNGLGLSIVKRILTKLNGLSGVESTVGSGSKFYFTLPKL